MIIVRRTIRSGAFASFGFSGFKSNPTGNRSQQNTPQIYQFKTTPADERKLIDTLNKAQNAGQNVQDPQVLMALVAKAGGEKKYPMFYMRARRTKGGKLVTERVRRKP